MERDSPHRAGEYRSSTRLRSPSAELATAQLDEIDAMQIDVAATSVRLEQSLVQVVDLLRAADITNAVLKGEATSHLDYADPSERQFGDVDLLVEPSKMVLARAVLESEVWRQAYPLPSPSRAIHTPAVAARFMVRH